ncbi:MAG: hypothetical protein DSY77_13990 [Bacteroidetes bacterium]|nr:MAG: hypothetical protein DSY77_13990 [Bacteroidota bacterium]
MAWIITLLAVLLYLVYKFNNDYRENLKEKVTSKGGMHKKYKELVDYLISTDLSITKITKDSIVLSSKNMRFDIYLVSNNTEIYFKGYLVLIGEVKKKWVYHHNHTQKDIIKDINNFFDLELSKYRGSKDFDNF